MGNDTLNVTQAGAITVPTGASVSNIENVNLLSGANITVNTTSGFTGLTSLKATSTSTAASTSLTAAATTNITSVESDLRASGTSQLIINGGNNVDVKATGTTTQATGLNATTGAGAEILIGATTAATGKVNVNNSFKGADTNVSGDVFVKGGTEVAIVQTLTNTTVNETNVQGAVAVLGTAATTAVSVVQDATVAASNLGTGRVGKTAGAVTVTDVNAASATAAGSIAQVTLLNAGDAVVNSGALTTLNLGGTLTQVDAGTLGALTTAANSTLALNLTGAVSTGPVTIDTDIKTLNVSGNTTASTINSLVASGATKINVSGDAKVTFTGNTTAAVTDIVVTNTAGAAFGTAIGANVNFTGGAGDDAVTLTTGFTKAITMGAGNDTVTYGGPASTTVGAKGSVDGGAGTDTIIMSSSDAAAADNDSVFNTSFKGFDVLRLSNELAVSTNIDLDGINAVSKVILASGGNNATSSVISNLVSGGTVETLTAGTAGFTVNVKSALVGADDVLNLSLKSTTALTNQTINAANVETINIAVADAAAAPALGSNAVVHALTLGTAAAKTITVTGNNGLTLTNTGNTAVTLFDASGVVANNTAAGAGVAATTDSAANLAVTFASANNTASADVTIKGGAGNDVLTGNISKDTISGGAGADLIYGDNQGTKEVQSIAASSTDGAAVLTVNVLGVNTTVTLAGATAATAMQTAVVNAINANTALAGLVTASAGATDAITLTYLVDGDAPAVTVTKASGAGALTLGAITATTTGTAGTAAVDVLDGGAGADLLVGGGGADTITTGAGADKVFLLKAHSNLATMTTITDFTFAAGGTSNDIIVLGDVTSVIGTTTTVQDLSSSATLAAAVEAAALKNTVDNGLSVFTWGGNEYVYVETTGATGSYVASDFIVKLTGTPLAVGATIAGSGFDAV
ncbi:hypothetical protein RY831_32190 [Noviherbaspirillum sp. CPCC 100848]|uniref:Calcium-binding protein n=1 Tax=Noviherbaspirillum album TaxID=3080276 RepID=A0ABU6JJB5_9BURK|nr:hypothetical protein [Noviherbaspirillum sp. CPCC 100848]MEC4723782.1 hypothetical protein [Noviherbaspirillum sp. CPCC 100848]